jgi:membrane fusion protein, adhesin transport system
MLNISENQVHLDISKYQSFGKTEFARGHVMFKRWIFTVAIIVLVVLFLPWTQNIRAKGKLTTLSPDNRPQTIHSTIAGRVEKWFVREGQLVKKGDTIIQLSEIKTDYFDPNLLSRTQAQVNAKTSAVGSYGQKAKALEAQIGQMRQELRFKKDQLNNKIEQTRLEAEAFKNELAAAKIDLETEQIQLKRTEQLFTEGLKSKTELENKRLKLQQTSAKLVATDNKYQKTLQEIDNLKFQLSGADSEYAGKISKTESERFSTMSDGFEAEATVQKLENQYANYEARSKFYIVVAPQDCYINRATTVGLGETVKEGEPIVSILPAKMDIGVEMFIEPIDLPLVKLGKPVRFIFDGWPAFIFSGWPYASVGTYAGRVVAIDNVADAKGKYRLLVAPDAETPTWPAQLRPGSGAQGFALLNDVPVWYELWRQLNGFPPEYYYGPDSVGEDKKEEKK